MCAQDSLGTSTVVNTYFAYLRQNINNTKNAQSFFCNISYI